MKKQLKNAMLLLAAACFSLTSGAQWVSKGVIYTTGGNFGDPGNKVKISQYDAENKVNKMVDGINGDFSNSVVVDGRFAYAHIGRGFGHADGQDVVYKYDLATGLRADSIENVPGLNKMFVVEDYLVLTFSWGASSNYVRIFDKGDLSAGPVFVDNNIPAFTSSAVSLNDSLYVSFTDNNTGKLGVFDLSGATPSFARIAELDSMSFGLNELYTDGSFIYGLSERGNGWGNPPMYAGVTKFNPASGLFSFAQTPRANGGIGLMNGMIAANFSDGPGLFSLATFSVFMNPLFKLDYTAVTADMVSSKVIFQQTDFWSMGRLFITDINGNPIDSINTDVSGSSVAMAYNYLPQAFNDNFTVPVNVLSVLDVLNNDVDLDEEEEITVKIISGPKNGIAVAGVNGISYTPNTSFTGMDTLVYTITDSWGDTDTASAFIGVGTSSIRTISKSDLKVFPVPAREVLNIEMSQANAGEIKIFDISGKVLKTTSVDASSVAVPVSDLTAGIYFIEVVSGNETIRSKFVKN